MFDHAALCAFDQNLKEHVVWKRGRAIALRQSAPAAQLITGLLHSRLHARSCQGWLWLILLRELGTGADEDRCPGADQPRPLARFGG